MAGGTPALPASRVLGTRASRSHGGKDALPGNAASKHAHEKPIPLRGQGVADKGTSLGFAVGRVRPLFALTPSPSPTLWERGVGARGSAPCSAFPLSRLVGEGDKGGEGNTARLPVHACAGENSPCCRDSVPSRCTLVRQGVGGILHAQEFVNFGSVVGRTTSDPLDNPPRSG
jgi:hypothetical protein